MVLILWASVVGFAQTTFYLAHVANGVQGPSVVWKTTILLTNPASSGTATGTITFMSESADMSTAGVPFSGLSVTDETGATATGTTFTFSIPAGGIHKVTSTGTGQFAQGFAAVTTNAGSVSGSAIFSEFDGAGNLIGEAGVALLNAVTRQAIFVDTVGNYKIGIAYANPGSSSANITLNLLNSSGNTVGAPVNQVLGPGNHTAVFTFQSSMFPSASPMTGTIQITSDSPLAVTALRFDPTLTKFTTLPPVTLDAGTGSANTGSTDGNTGSTGGGYGNYY